MDGEITFNEKSPAKIGRISSKYLKEAGSSKGKTTSRNNVSCTTASFQEDEDHVDMEVDRIDEEFLSESESSDDDSVKIVVTKKQLDQWRQNNRKKDRADLIKEMEAIASDGLTRNKDRSRTKGRKGHGNRSVSESALLYDRSNSREKTRSRSSSRESGECSDDELMQESILSEERKLHSKDRKDKKRKKR